MHLIFSSWRQNKDTARTQEEIAPLHLAERVLSARGLDAEKRQLFLAQSQAQDLLWNPYRMKGMRQLVTSLWPRLKTKEHVLIHGDYDLDGLSSSALMSHYFEKLGLKVSLFIPDRVEDGYGLGEKSIQRILEVRPDFVLTVDCGISACEAIATIQAEGIPVYVTDHHQAPPVLPEAEALIDPKQPGESYPNPNLAGVGVALKLVQALEMKRAVEAGDLDAHVFEQESELLETEGTEENERIRAFLHDVSRPYFAWAMLGTVADLMELTKENVCLINAGLAQIAEGKAPIGIAVLLDAMRLSQERLTVTDVSFRLAPAFNAAGRLGDLEVASSLLMTQDPKLARMLAGRLIEINDERKALCQKEEERAKSWIEAHPEVLSHAVLLVDLPKSHPGILGILAVRLATYYHKPCLVFTDEGVEREDAMLRGSGRSYADIPLHDCLTQAAKQVAFSFGGHQQALGAEVKRADLPKLAQALDEAFLSIEAEWSQLKDCNRRFERHYDLELDFVDLNLEAARSLRFLEPTGPGRKAPVFLTRGLVIDEVKTLGQDQNHLKLSLLPNLLTARSEVVEGLAFGQAQQLPFLSGRQAVDLLYTLDINEWRGREKVQLIIQHLQWAEEKCASKNPERSNEDAPAEEALDAKELNQSLVRLWQILDAALELGGIYVDPEALAHIYWPKICVKGKKVSVETLTRLLRIFVELDLIYMQADGDLYFVVRREQTGERRSLSESQTYRTWQKGDEDVRYEA